MHNEVTTTEPVRRMLYTHDEMAASLGIGPTQFKQLIADGCPRVMLGPRCPRYNPDDVMAWLREQRAQGDMPLERAVAFR